MTPSHQRVRLKPADSFDLIRLLARSQHDPRKAVCELVQNSLDARSRTVEVSWFNEGGRRCLRIDDDGEGIFPELEREEALRKIASTIGHSHKRSLTPEQRRELMLLGKYGIGLLGFWSVGQVLEIRSRVRGGTVAVLKLIEDHPHGEIRHVTPRRLDEPDTYTQVTIRGLHDGAIRQLHPARLHLYLASELRGQLLRRPVRLVIRDRVSRGRARKLFDVQPARYRGRRLEAARRLTVAGQDDALVELYLVPEETEQPGHVKLACGGSTVLDDLAQIDGLDQPPRAPWSSGRLEGVVDFPDLTVTPSTRRGFLHDTAALAFLAALPTLEAQILEALVQVDQQREAERQQDVARQIRKAFVSVANALPQYDLLDLAKLQRAAAGEPGGTPLGGPDARDGAALESATLDPGGGAELSGPEPGPETDESRGDEARPIAAQADPNPDWSTEPEPELFPPGPVHRVEIRPRRARLAPGGTCSFQARALDAHGRPARAGHSWQWTCQGGGRIEGRADQAQYHAPDESADVTIEVLAQDGEHAARTQARVRVLEELFGQQKVAGIPEPEPLHAPLEPWRSRLLGQRWQFNTGHPDCIAASETPRDRLRYLIHLFAKELVLRNFGTPGDSAILERMVEVLTHLKRSTGTDRRTEE